MRVYLNGEPISLENARKHLMGAAIHSGDDVEEYLAYFYRAIHGDEYAIDDVFRLSNYSMEIFSEEEE